VVDDRTRSREVRVAAAYDFLAANGTPRDRDHLTLAKVAVALGMSRSNLYRHWPTSAEFVDDVVALQAMPAGAWHNQAAARWDEVTVVEALIEALEIDEGDAALRSSLSVRPHSSLARAQVASWERDWLNRFAQRLRAEYGTDGDDAPWTDIAVSLAALVEGMFLLRLLLAGSPGAPSHEQAVDLTVTTVDRMARYLAESARGDAGPLHPPPDEPAARPKPAGAHRTLQRTLDALSDGTIQRNATDRRLVDMDALARQQGVTSRSLYKLWPTATDLNADLFGESVRRVRIGIANIGLATFSSSSGSGFNYFTPLLLHINEEVLKVEVFPDARPFIAMVELASNRAVLDRHGATIREWFADGEMFAAALLQVSGRRPVPGFSLSDHTWLAVASELGAWRMVAMHDNLMDRTIRYLGHDVIALAGGIDAHTEVWTDHDEVPVDQRTTPMLPSIDGSGDELPG